MVRVEWVLVHRCRRPPRSGRTASAELIARWSERCRRSWLRKYGSGCSYSDTYIVGVLALALASYCALTIFPCAKASRKVDVRLRCSCSGNLRMY